MYILNISPTGAISIVFGVFAFVIGYIWYKHLKFKEDTTVYISNLYVLYINLQIQIKLLEDKKQTEEQPKTEN